MSSCVRIVENASLLQPGKATLNVLGPLVETFLWAIRRDGTRHARDQFLLLLKLQAQYGEQQALNATLACLAPPM